MVFPKVVISLRALSCNRSKLTRGNVASNHHLLASLFISFAPSFTLFPVSLYGILPWTIFFLAFFPSIMHELHGSLPGTLPCFRSSCIYCIRHFSTSHTSTTTDASSISITHFYFHVFVESFSRRSHNNNQFQLQRKVWWNKDMFHGMHQPSKNGTQFDSISWWNVYGKNLCDISVKKLDLKTTKANVRHKLRLQIRNISVSFYISRLPIPFEMKSCRPSWNR